MMIDDFGNSTTNNSSYTDTGASGVCCIRLQNPDCFGLRCRVDQRKRAEKRQTFRFLQLTERNEPVGTTQIHERLQRKSLRRDETRRKKNRVFVKGDYI